MSATNQIISAPIDGVSVNLRINGPDDGRTLLWLHGEWGLLPAEQEILAGLEDGPVRCIAPDQPGWGMSTGDGSLPSLEDVALLYWWLLEEIGVDGPVVIAGTGIGGALAAEMAVMSPGLVERLVLLNPAGIWDDAIGGADIFSFTQRDLMPALFADPKGAAATSLFPKPTDPHEAAQQGIARAKALGPAGRYLFPMFHTGIERRLYRLSGTRDVPTTILWGAQNAVLPVGLAGRWQSAIGHAHVEIVGDAGYMLTLEAPDLVAEALAPSTLAN